MAEGLPPTELELLQRLRGPSGPRAPAVPEHGRGLSGRPRAARHVPDEEPLFPRRRAPIRSCAGSSPSSTPSATRARRSRGASGRSRRSIAGRSRPGVSRADPSLLLGPPEGRESPPDRAPPEGGRGPRRGAAPVAERRRPPGARRSPFATAPSSSSCTAPVSASVRSRPSPWTGSTSRRGRVLVLGKGSKEREVPISEYAADALQRLPARGTSRRWPPRDRAISSSIGAANPSVSAISVRWLSGMALPCCRGGG